MSAVKYGTISGAVFGTTPETGTDIIMDEVTVSNSCQETQLADEDGDIVATAFHGFETEVTMSFAVKGSDHYGADGLVGSVITTLQDAGIPTPLIVTANSRTKAKADWQKGTLTAKYYGAGYTTSA